MGTGGQRPSGLLLARVRGIPVYVGSSWPLLALVVVGTFGPTVPVTPRPLGYAVAAAYAVLLLVSVLAHEAGHAVAARALGARVDRVVADLWGGHTVFDGEQLRPGATAVVAVAGPAGNAAVAALGWAFLQVLDGGLAGLLVGALVVTNAFVAGFNLLPGLPLDGGFVVDALVWKVTGDRARGLLVAGWLGRVVTVLVAAWFVVVPLVRGQGPSIVTIVWVGLLGGFLWVGATRALRAGAARRAFQAVRLGALLRPVTVVPADATAEQVLTALHRSTTSGRAVLAGPGGAPLGFIDPAALAAVPADRLGSAPAVSFLVQPPEGWVVPGDPDDDAVALVHACSRLDQAGAGGHPVLVVDRTGRPLGAVAAGDLVPQA